METNQPDWISADSTEAEGPSLDFISAVAELLETDPRDILAELGYAHKEEPLTAVSKCVTRCVRNTKQSFSKAAEAYDASAALLCLVVRWMIPRPGDIRAASAGNPNALFRPRT